MNYPGLWEYKVLLLTRKHSDNTIRPVIIRCFSWWYNVRIFSSLSFRVLYDWSTHQQNRISLQREKHRYTRCPLSLTSKTFDALTEKLYHSDDVSITNVLNKNLCLFNTSDMKLHTSHPRTSTKYDHVRTLHIELLHRIFKYPSHWAIDPLRINRSSLISCSFDVDTMSFSYEVFSSYISFRKSYSIDVLIMNRERESCSDTMEK